MGIRVMATVNEIGKHLDLSTRAVTALWPRARRRFAGRQRLTGRMVDLGEVARVWAARVTRCRTRLLAIPAKVAARVRMASTIVEVHHSRGNLRRAYRAGPRRGDDWRGRSGGS